MSRSSSTTRIWAIAVEAAIAFALVMVMRFVTGAARAPFLEIGGARQSPVTAM
jgi:hypothetical protein